MKVLLGNKLNEFCLDTLCFLPNVFFNWDSSFWLTSFWGCSLEFLSIITASVNWGTVFDLEIPTWLLLHTKLSSYLILWKIGVLVTVCFQCLSMQRFFFGFKRIFCSCSFVSLLYFKKYFWEKLSISFWTFDNVVTFSIFLYYLQIYFLFTGMTIVLTMAKNCYSVKYSFSF